MTISETRLGEVGFWGRLLGTQPKEVPLDISPEEIHKLLMDYQMNGQTGVMSTPMFNDSRYSVLRSDVLEDFVFKHHNRFQAEYIPDVYDCDDFAIAATADISKAAMKQRMKLPLAFGRTRFTRPNGTGHMMNFAITSDKGLMFYEAGNGTWISSDTLKGANFYFEL